VRGDPVWQKIASGPNYTMVYIYESNV